MNIFGLIPTGALVWTEPFIASLPADDALRVTGDSFDATGVLIWSVGAFVTVLCIALLVQASRQLHDNEYERAFWTFTASMLFGLSPYIAKTLFFE